MLFVQIVHKLLPKEIETGSQDKQTDFEFKAFGCDRMNRFWHKTVNEAASGFDNFSIGRLGIEDPGRKRSLGITFANGTHAQS